MFEQANAILLPSLILERRLDEPRPQRRAHDRHVAGDRDSLSAGVTAPGNSLPCSAGSTNA